MHSELVEPNSAMTEIGEVNEKECVIEWTINNFSSMKTKVDECYHSPPFSFDGARWHLEMCPNGETAYGSVGYVGLYLARDSSGPPIELDFSLGLKTSNNEIAEEGHCTNKFGEEFDIYGCIEFLKRSILLERHSELVPSGHLTCVCRLKYPESPNAASAIPTAKCADSKETGDAGSLSLHERKCVDKTIRCPKCSDAVAVKHCYAHECQVTKEKGDNSPSGSLVTNKILEDLKQLFLNQQNCDVILRVKGQEFQAHKLILTARSPAFASLFQDDTKEKATAVVDIEDCNPSIFSDFLRFLYCQEVDRLSEENVLSLLAAADKYRVSDLRTKCLEFMKEKFSVHTLDDTVALRHPETESIQLAAA